MDTYIEAQSDGMEFGIKIGAVLREGVTALEVVKKLLPDGFNVDDAKFITAEEYARDYGDDDEEEFCEYEQ